MVTFELGLEGGEGGSFAYIWGMFCIPGRAVSKCEGPKLGVCSHLEIARRSCLEKAMAPHSSILVWKIPWMVEPGGLPSMGLQSRTQLKRLSSSSKRSCDCKDVSDESEVKER